MDMPNYAEPMPELSVASRRVEGVRKISLSSRDEWLGLRRSYVGASDVAALFAAHPYRTAAQLFAEKTGQYTPNFSEAIVEEDAIMMPPTERGLMLESVAVRAAARIHPEWRIEANGVPGGYLFADDEAGLASTPDAFIYSPNEAGPGAFQIKSVAEPVYRGKWFEGGLPQAPLAFGVQTTIDAALSGCSWGVIGVLVVGFGIEFRLFRISIRPGIVERARELTREFWRRVAAGEPYPFDYGRDGDLIASLYGDDDGSTIDLGANNRIVELLAQRDALAVTIKAGTDATEARKTIDRELIADHLGNATAGRLADGRLITAKTTRRGAYSVEATSYRTVRIQGAGGPAKRGKAAAAPAAAPESF